jgi:hypothetical protein
VTPITQWFETRVGDNVEPQVANVAYLAYDERYLYAGFKLEDPKPSLIRAPLGDHDAVPSSTDYAGLIVDSRNDGKTAQMFLANPNGVQYDALSSDISGEDSSPDYYWDAVGKITDTGWNLEIRIPFSSLRYKNEAVPTWGLLLYRNYPRDRRYQFFSARLPRDVSCFVCNSSKLTGLTDLPHGSHLVVAPFTTGSQQIAPKDGVTGNPLEAGEFDSEFGADLKWNPLADAAIDATINPDFSQIESDVAQISANERFALFYPEKRPFFLEGIDLFNTPLQAVYTRTITSPRAGLRATGRIGGTQFTVLGTHDRGGGAVIMPGPEGSYDVDQDFASDVGVFRGRRDFGQSFVSALFTTREMEGDAYNRVYGPDLQWRPGQSDAITGEALWSDTKTLVRTDLDPEFDGRRLQDDAQLLNWQHGSTHWDWFLQGLNVGSDFRSYNGFVPQVGYREGYVEGGYTIRPKGLLSRVRLFTIGYEDQLPDGDLLARRACVGFGADGLMNSFTRVELNREEFLVDGQILQRFRPRLHLEASPGRLLNFFSVDAYILDEIDFANAREGNGTTITSNVTLRPSSHLELRADVNGRWLYVDPGGGVGSTELLQSGVQRLRAQWSFNARSFVRVIGQHIETLRNPAIYTSAVDQHTESLDASALFAYKVNWQTVLFVGFGNQQEFLPDTDQLETADGTCSSNCPTLGSSRFAAVPSEESFMRIVRAAALRGCHRRAGSCRGRRWQGGRVSPRHRSPEVRRHRRQSVLPAPARNRVGL